MMLSREFEIFEEHGAATKLVVLFHAYTSSPQDLNDVAQIVRESFGSDADILRPKLPFDMFSCVDWQQVVDVMIDRLDEIWAAKASRNQNGYEEIYLAGHSSGALLTRQVYVTAVTSQHAWARRVKRLILFAAMNRGWRISHHLSIPRAIFLTIGTIAGNIVQIFTHKPLIIFQIRRGAPFLTQLRLQWLNMRKEAREEERRIKKEIPESLARQEALREIPGNAQTVQLLGTIDDLVSPEDNIDLVSGGEFVYLDVPASGHVTVIDLTMEPKARDAKWYRRFTSPNLFSSLHTTLADREREEERVRNRAQVFRDALLKDELALSEMKAQVSDRPRSHVDESVTDVIFVVHGIRDAGYWTQKIARRVKKLGDHAGDDKKPRRKFAMETSSYGYFPMAPFLIAAKRQEKVEWLMDQYAEAKAQYPNAKFSCVAHSNGTYLLAKALEEYSSCCFERIVFIGSVVRKDYRWERFLQKRDDYEPQVCEVLNYVASADWVVAFFPNLFEFVRIQDLGGAGHRGFGNEKFDVPHYVKGGHSAALDESNWQSIAEFVVHGTRPEVPESLKALKRSRVVATFGRFPPLVWLAIIAALIFGGMKISDALPNSGMRASALIAYVWVIWKVLTRI